MNGDGGLMSASGACNLLCTAAALLSRLCPAVTGFSFTAVFNLTVNSTELSEELLNSSKDKKKSKITAEQTHGWGEERGREHESLLGLFPLKGANTALQS